VTQYHLIGPRERRWALALTELGLYNLYDFGLYTENVRMWFSHDEWFRVEMRDAEGLARAERMLKRRGFRRM